MIDRVRFYGPAKPADGTPLLGVAPNVAQVKAARAIEITSFVVAYTGLVGGEGAYLNISISGTATFNTRVLGYDVGPFVSNKLTTLSDLDAVLTFGEYLQICQLFHSGAACSVLTVTANAREYQL